MGSLPPRARDESWCPTTTSPVSILKSCCTQQPCKIMKSKLSKLKYVYLRSCKNVFSTSNERRLTINCTHNSCYTLPQTTFDVFNSYIHILQTNSPAAPFKLWAPGFHLHLSNKDLQSSTDNFTSDHSCFSSKPHTNNLTCNKKPNKESWKQDPYSTLSADRLIKWHSFLYERCTLKYLQQDF